jgi:hypothetical protein
VPLGMSMHKLMEDALMLVLSRPLTATAAANLPLQ